MGIVSEALKLLVCKNCLLRGDKGFAHQCWRNYSVQGGEEIAVTDNFGRCAHGLWVVEQTPKNAKDPVYYNAADLEEAVDLVGSTAYGTSRILPRSEWP